MPELLKLPRLARDLPGRDIRLLDAGGVTALDFSASSEVPLERWYGTEILSHDPAAIRLGRIAGGAAPLLFNHNWDDPIGMIESGAVRDNRLQVRATLFDTERAREVRSMIDGGLRNVSIGYEIHAMEEDRKGGRFTATDWEPLEVSIVTIPADPGVGIGRAHDDAFKPVRVTRATSATANTAASHGDHPMTQETNPPAGDIAETKAAQPRVEIRSEPAPKVDGIEIEKRRKASIQNLCRANHIDARLEEHWVKTGASLEQVADELVTVLEERGKATNAPAMLGMARQDVRRYSVLRALRAVLSKDWSKAGLELEAHKALMARGALNPRSENSFYIPMDIQVRDMTAAGVSGSNYLVSTDNLASSFIDLLRNESVVMQLGATRLSGLTGNVTIPRQTAASTAYWLANETAQITESQPTIGQVTLAPKNVAALTEISHQLMQQSDPSAEQLVITDLARVIALAADIAALRGGGANGQPQGIVGTDGVGSFDTDGTDTFGDVLSAQTDVAAANALRPGCAYVADPASAALLMARSRFANTDTPVWDGSLLEGRMAGFPARSTNQMSANTMLFGWWPSIIMAEWGVLELMVNPYSDFTRGLSAIRAWYTMDVAMRYPAAFSYDATVA
jgi:HK97 family phage major capsid protein/HK97 family phage prohead protease